MTTPPVPTMSAEEESRWVREQTEGAIILPDYPRPAYSRLSGLGVTELYLSGMGIEQIAKAVLASNTTVRKYLHEHGVTMRKIKNYGKCNQNADTIWGLYGEGKSVSEIAEEIGVHRNSVRLFFKREAAE